MTELLERDMEDVVARCPDLFMEAGLHFVRRQIVLNGRRPDILFEDVLSRHLLVEHQRGKPDEEQLPRHDDYFYDYRAKYPKRIHASCFSRTVLFLSTKNSWSTTVTSTRRYPNASFRGDG